jgi:FAD/FMN-containing dehydrogenase
MERFDGAVLRDGDSGFDQACSDAVWNGLKPNRRPAIVVVAASRDDAARAVRLAAAEGLSVGVRSGGHAWGGNALRDGGLLLDLSRLDSIEIDTNADRAVVEPGVRGNVLTAALAPRGRYFPGGHCPTVGLAGFTLGGGFGFNSRVIGPAAFSLRAVDVVLADGSEVHATDDAHTEILWAARGSGPGFFGVVTRLHLDIRPLPGVVAASVQIYPIEVYDELLPWYAHTAAAVSPKVNPVLIAAAHSPVPHYQGTILMVANYVFADDMQEAAALLAPLESAPCIDRAVVRAPAHPSSIDEQYALLDQLYPPGHRYLTDNLWVRPLEPQLWPDAKAIFETLPSAGSHVVLAPWVPQSHSNAAFGLQTEMSFHVYAVYDDAAEDASMLAWHADALGRIEAHSVGGGKVNDSNLFVRPMAVMRPDAANRLEALRRRYDPDGRFDGYPSELPDARAA